MSHILLSAEFVGERCFAYKHIDSSGEIHFARKILFRKLHMVCV